MPAVYFSINAVARFLGPGYHSGAAGAFHVTAPNTETPPNPTFFGKSIAFVIQPVGTTPNISSAPLPSFPYHVICQIVCSPCWLWHEERPNVTGNVDVTFEAKTEPPITEYYQYKYDWYIEGEAPRMDWGPQMVYRFAYNWPAGCDVKVVITERSSGRRISGDLINVLAH